MIDVWPPNTWTKRAAARCTDAPKAELKFNGKKTLQIQAAAVEPKLLCGRQLLNHHGLPVLGAPSTNANRNPEFHGRNCKCHIPRHFHRVLQEYLKKRAQSCCSKMQHFKESGATSWSHVLLAPPAGSSEPSHDGRFVTELFMKDSARCSARVHVPTCRQAALPPCMLIVKLMIHIVCSLVFVSLLL